MLAPPILHLPSCHSGPFREGSVIKSKFGKDSYSVARDGKRVTLRCLSGLIDLSFNARSFEKQGQSRTSNATTDDQSFFYMVLMILHFLLFSSRLFIVLHFHYRSPGTRALDV